MPWINKRLICTQALPWLLGGTTGTYIVGLLVAVAFWMITCHAFLTGCRVPRAGFRQSLSTLEAFVKHCDLIANWLVAIDCEGYRQVAKLPHCKSSVCRWKGVERYLPAEWQWMFMEEIVRQQLRGGGKNTIFIMSKYNHTLYLSYFLHGQYFWRIKFTPKNA